MRFFQDLHEAIPEIRRDLYKGPRVVSTRVQNMAVREEARELQNYAYTIAAGGIPLDDAGILEIAEQHFGWEPKQLRPWLAQQVHERIENDGLATSTWNGDTTSDRLHPELAALIEGSHYSYTYAERLYGAVQHAATILLQNPDTRRCFIPIFQSIDFLRAAAMTRIPCSLGYQLMIRPVPGGAPQLHLTYISRSCDFDKFWLTDIYLASRFQDAVWNEVTNRWNGEGRFQTHSMPECGHTSHLILSFHHFIDGSEVF